MNKYILMAAVLLFTAASCNEAANNASTEIPAMPAEPAKTEASKYTKGAKMDPICEMSWDTSWTEYTVYMNDTVKFCSENCKTAFLARPEKYVK
jgi:YHS domain-containing protein